MLRYVFGGSVSILALFAASPDNFGPEDNIICYAQGDKNVIALASTARPIISNAQLKDGMCQGEDSSGTRYSAPLSAAFCGLDEKDRPVIVNDRGQLLHLAQGQPKRGNLYELFGLSAGKYGSITLGENSCKVTSFGVTYEAPRSQGMVQRLNKF